MSENGSKGDARDFVVRNPLDILQEYDTKMQEILSIAAELSTTQDASKDSGLGLLQEKIKSILSTPEFKSIIPEDVREYFEHDASGFRRRVLGFLQIIDRDLQRYVESDHTKIPDLSSHLSFVQKNWLKYRLVLEDLLLRTGVEAGVIVDRDKQRNTEELFLALNSELEDRCEKPSWGLEKEFIPSFEEIAKARVSVPLGVIFNFFQNCISNATHPEIKASKFKLKITLDTDNMVIEFWDNGKGMDENTKEKAFNKGFSAKNGKGLGLAGAPKRFTSYNANVEVISNSNPNPGSDDWTTKFILKAP